MARKPRDQWTPEYRKRIEGAERRGKTRQEARGHRVGEHRVRKAKSVVHTGLTPYQRGRVLKFARSQAKRTKGADIKAFELRFAAQAQKLGWADFKKIFDKQKALEKAAKAWPAAGTQVRSMRGEMADFLEDLGLDGDDPDDLSLLFYG